MPLLLRLYCVSPMRTTAAVTRIQWAGAGAVVLRVMGGDQQTSSTLRPGLSHGCGCAGQAILALELASCELTLHQVI